MGFRYGMGCDGIGKLMKLMNSMNIAIQDLPSSYITLPAY
jgi:hypothetical protein